MTIASLCVYLSVYIKTALAYRQQILGL